MHADLKTVKKEDLCRIFRRFYVEVRRKDGTSYQRPSLMGIRAALQRHLRSPDVGRKDIDILHGKKFVDANNTLDAYLKHLTREGQLKAVQHKPRTLSRQRT